MTRTLLLTAALLAGATIGAPPASACSCLGLCDTTPCVEDALNSSDVVFLGKVTGVADGPRDLKVFTLAVDRVWKGARGRYVDVQTYPGTGMCGFPFTKGGEYLVFAHERDGALHASTCSLTAEVKKARTRMRRLDKLQRRVPK